jgi:hypothetical protein
MIVSGHAATPLSAALRVVQHAESFWVQEKEDMRLDQMNLWR